LDSLLKIIEAIGIEPRPAFLAVFPTLGLELQA
jgi:hypothetical protein